MPDIRQQQWASTVLEPRCCRYNGHAWAILGDAARLRSSFDKPESVGVKPLQVARLSPADIDGFDKGVGRAAFELEEQ